MNKGVREEKCWKKGKAKGGEYDHRGIKERNEEKEKINRDIRRKHRRVRKGKEKQRKGESNGKGEHCNKVKKMDERKEEISSYKKWTETGECKKGWLQEQGNMKSEENRTSTGGGKQGKLKLSIKNKQGKKNEE